MLPMRQAELAVLQAGAAAADEEAIGYERVGSDRYLAVR
jgi:hypothetical protein